MRNRSANGAFLLLGRMGRCQCSTGKSAEGEVRSTVGFRSRYSILAAVTSTVKPASNRCLLLRFMSARTSCRDARKSKHSRAWRGQSFLGQTYPLYPLMTISYIAPKPSQTMEATPKPKASKIVIGQPSTRDGCSSTSASRRVLRNASRLVRPRKITPERP